MEVHVSHVAEALVRIGFPEPVEIGHLRTVAHLFGTRKLRSGVYALLLPGDRVYIGKAIDLVRRFAQHRLAHEVIDGYTFLRAPALEMDATERACIAAAERLGLWLANVALVKDVAGETDLDMVVAQAVQDRWVRDPFAVNLEEDPVTERIELPPAQVDRYRRHFERLRERSYGAEAIRLLATYLMGAVPFPRTTEYSFWSVSCLPSTRVPSGQRIVVVNAGVIELFVLSSESDPASKELFGFVNVDADVWLDEFGSEKAFERRHPDVVGYDATYRYAADIVQLHADRPEDMAGLLCDARVQRAAGALALRIMRQRATIFTKFHAKLLAEAAIEAMGDEQAAHVNPARWDPNAVLDALVPHRYRQAVLRTLADSIEAAHRAHPERWSLRMSDAGITLKVGAHEVLQVGTWVPPVQLMIDRSAVPAEVRAERGAHFTEDRSRAGNPRSLGFYTGLPGSEACRLPFAQVGRAFGLLRSAHEMLVAKAAQDVPHPAVRRMHARTMVEFIARGVGRALPQPTTD